MPDARLQRLRRSYRCDMCGEDLLIGSHQRILDVDGRVRHLCPTRLHCVTPIAAGLRLTMKHGEA